MNRVSSIQIKPQIVNPTPLITRKTAIVLACAALLVTSGCGQQEPVAEEPPLQSAKPEVEVTSVLDVVHADETVLATVNGTRIGDQDLSINMLRTLGDSYLQLVDSSVEEKILQSMIASRAIASQALDAMTEDERIALEKRVALFREELLVKDYLLNNADPHTITSTQIEAFYNDNTDEFRGREERLYEIITVATGAYKQDAQSALQTLQLAKNHDDWRSLSVEHRRAQNPIELAHGYETWHEPTDSTGNDNESPLNAAVKELQVGQMSRIIMQDGAPYLVRLLEINQGEPIPLSQARASIKRKLLPASVRKSVREVSDAILAKSEVVVVDSAWNSQ